MRRDELLLLADRVEESERVRSEADQRERAQRKQAQTRAGEHRQALAPRGAENQERQQQPRRELDADAGDEHAGGSPEAWAGARGEHQGGGQHEHDQRVVVGTADRQHQQHGVEAHERGRPASR